MQVISSILKTILKVIGGIWFALFTLLTILALIEGYLSGIIFSIILASIGLLPFHLFRKKKTVESNLDTPPNTNSLTIEKAAPKESRNTIPIADYESQELENYKYLEVKKYEILGNLDESTCSVCGEMDGKVFKVKDWKTGVTAPPFHDFCRCTTTPHIPDDFGERAARDKDGKTYYVSSNIKYTKWAKQQGITPLTPLEKAEENEKLRAAEAEKQAEESRQQKIRPEVQKEIIQILTNGDILQKDLYKHFGENKQVAVSIVQELHKKGIIEKTKTGNTFLLSLQTKDQ